MSYKSYFSLISRLSVIFTGGDRDEVLDWQEMTKRYEGAKQVVVPGIDHSFSCFSDYIDDILRFAEMA